MTLPWFHFDERVLALEEALEGLFVVRDVELRSGDRLVAFKGECLRSPELVYEAVAPRFKALSFIPILRREAGFDVITAYPAPASRGRPRRWVNAVLFVLTVATTLLAGTYQALPSLPALAQPDGPADLFGLLFNNLLLGVPFTVALLGILGVHEFGHYFTARHYGLDVSLPYFLPFPSPYTGTLGAVIRIQSPFESKKALFDVGIAGPLAGLAVAVPVVILGLMRAELASFPPGSDVLVFSEPLLFRFLAHLIVGERPPGTDLVMNPLLMAGWIGFLITAINLLPVSQLDGGHIAYALMGRFHRPFAWAFFGVIVLITLLHSQAFVLMALFIFMMGIEHPPALNDLTHVGRSRVVLGVLTLLFALTLVTLTPFDTTTVPGGS